eukprot:gene9076-14055_t
MDAEVATWDEERARQLGIDYDPSQHWLERTDKVREALRKKRANKASYLQLSKKLQGMLETPRHTTMVPAGKLAFLEATVVHTNDILAFLGDAYFAERSVAQCKAMIDRRILYIDQDLDRLTSESEHCTQRLGLLDFFSGIGAGGNGPKPRQPGDSATWASPAGNLVASDRLGPTDTAVPTKEGPEASGRLKNTSPVAEKLLEVDRSNIKETLARIAEMEARGQRVGLLGGESAPDSDDNLRPLTEAELHERLVASEATSRIIEIMEEDDEEEEEEEEEDEEEGSTGLDKAAVGYRMRLAGITDGGDGVVPSYKGSLLSKLDNMLNPGVEQPLYANPADIFKAWDAPSSSQQQHPIPCQAPKNQMEDNAVRAEVSVSKEPDGKMREAPSATPGVVKDTVVLKGDSSACLPPPPPRERKPRLRSYMEDHQVLVEMGFAVECCITARVYRVKDIRNGSLHAAKVWLGVAISQQTEAVLKQGNCAHLVRVVAFRSDKDRQGQKRNETGATERNRIGPASDQFPLADLRIRAPHLSEDLALLLQKLWSVPADASHPVDDLLDWGPVATRLEVINSYQQAPSRILQAHRELSLYQAELLHWLSAQIGSLRRYHSTLARSMGKKHTLPPLTPPPLPPWLSAETGEERSKPSHSPLHDSPQVVAGGSPSLPLPILTVLRRPDADAEADEDPATWMDGGRDEFNATNKDMRRIANRAPPLRHGQPRITREPFILQPSSASSSVSESSSFSAVETSDSNPFNLISC